MQAEEACLPGYPWILSSAVAKWLAMDNNEMVGTGQWCIINLSHKQNDNASKPNNKHPRYYAQLWRALMKTWLPKMVPMPSSDGMYRWRSGSSDSWHEPLRLIIGTMIITIQWSGFTDDDIELYRPKHGILWWYGFYKYNKIITVICPKKYNGQSLIFRYIDHPRSIPTWVSHTQRCPYRCSKQIAWIFPMGS